MGIHVDAVDLVGASEEIAGWVASRRRSYVCVTGVHGVIEAQRSQLVKEAIGAAGLVVADGMPLVWCGKYAKVPVGHVRGADLMLAVLERGLAPGWRHAFYGSSEEVLKDLQDRMVSRFPTLRIVEVISPPYHELSEEDGLDHVLRLNSAQADVVWVGLSTPKQEQWMHRWSARLAAPAVVGVGAAFDFHAGHVKQAPQFLHDTGIEWAYRLAREPRRLWRRYARNNPEFVLRILRHRPAAVA